MKPSLKLLDYSILQQCMHCGMCLPACPTYVATNKERHSPRGRISLMRAVADGELKISPAFADEMSYCLGCLACQTACPAGVDYSNLLETARAEVQSSGLNQTFTSRFWRTVTIRGLFMRPRLARLHVGFNFLELLRVPGLFGGVIFDADSFQFGREFGGAGIRHRHGPGVINADAQPVRLGGGRKVETKHQGGCQDGFNEDG